MESYKRAWMYMRKVRNIKHENKNPWLWLHKRSRAQVALQIIEHNIENFTNKSFNHGTEDKVTPIGLTALMLMFLLNEENIK